MIVDREPRAIPCTCPSAVPRRARGQAQSQDCQIDHLVIAQLRVSHNDVVRQPVPERFVELLRRLQGIQRRD